VLESLDRCIDGDGDGCVAVGEYYERGRRDAFSAIKWYAKGCGLASEAACTALERVKDASPPHEAA
jgi:TPR repeat protein